MIAVGVQISYRWKCVVWAFSPNDPYTGPESPIPGPAQRTPMARYLFDGISELGYNTGKGEPWTI